VFGGPGEGVVVQQHQVHVEQRGEFGRRLGRQVSLQRLQLRRDGVARVAQAVDFGFDAFVVDEVVGHVDAARRHQHGAPDRHAVRHR
jgi:hypothetical protein